MNQKFPFQNAVKVLEPIQFDCATAESSSRTFGKSEIPVTLLPALKFDCRPAPRPALQLTLYLRPDLAPASAALEVMKLVKELDWYERGMGGHGLSWDHAHSDATPDQGVIRLVLTGSAMAGAQERFRRLKDAVNGTTDPDVTPPVSLRANENVFAKREAVLLATVA